MGIASAFFKWKLAEYTVNDIAKLYAESRNEIKQGKWDGQFGCSVQDMAWNDDIDHPRIVGADPKWEYKNTLYKTVALGVLDIKRFDIGVEEIEKEWDDAVKPLLDVFLDEEKKKEANNKLKAGFAEYKVKKRQKFIDYTTGEVKTYMEKIYGKPPEPEILSEEVVEMIKPVEIDSGPSFLNGEPTSPDDPRIQEANDDAAEQAKQAEKQSEQQSPDPGGLSLNVSATVGTELAAKPPSINNSTGNVFSNGLGVVTSSASVASAAIVSAMAAPKIVTDAVTYLQSALTEHIAESLVKIVTPPTAPLMDYVNQYTLAYFPPNPNEILNKLTQGLEEYNASIADSISEELTASLNVEAGQKMQGATKKVNDALSTAKTKIESIASKVQNGPAWLDKETKKIVDITWEETTSFIDKYVDDFEEKKDKWAKDQALKIANKNIQPKIEKIVNAQKIALEKIEQAKTVAITASKAAIAQAAMKLKGLLGG